MGHTMTDKEAAGQSAGDDGAVVPERILSPEAMRALAEAAERRVAAEKVVTQRPAELGGRAGPEPVRYGDWEKGGIASDF